MRLLPWSNLAPSERSQWALLLQGAPFLTAERLRERVIDLLKDEIQLTKEIRNEANHV